MSKKNQTEDNPEANTVDILWGLTSDEIDALAALQPTKDSYREARVELMSLSSKLEKGSVASWASLPMKLGGFTNERANLVLQEIARRRKSILA